MKYIAEIQSVKQVSLKINSAIQSIHSWNPYSNLEIQNHVKFYSFPPLGSSPLSSLNKALASGILLNSIQKA